MSWYRSWAPYVPVARRRANAASYAAKLAKKEGRPLAPIQIEGRAIASSFWGKAWCDHLESYSDFANRLPRGRTYVRNGSVIDLQISAGKVKALVSGSSVYSVTIDIDTLPRGVWSQLKKDCSRSVASLIDLLQGRFDSAVMARLTEKKTGLFPKPNEISMKCSCPDYATMCKHVAAVLYGVGARLDHSPELLFTLRDVDHLELVGEAVSAQNLNESLRGDTTTSIAASDLGAMFGIELETAEASAESAPTPRGPKKTTATKTAKKKTPVKRMRTAPAAKVGAIKKSQTAKAKKAAPAAKRKG